jgi:hypothetical protein
VGRILWKQGAQNYAYLVGIPTIYSGSCSKKNYTLESSELKENRQGIGNKA